MTQEPSDGTNDSERHAGVVRSMIDAENRLVNERMAWLTTLQGLLFAALAFVWEKPKADVFMDVVCGVGIVISTVILSTLVSASRAQRELLAWWDGHRKGYDGPDVIGRRPSGLRAARYVAPWSVIAMTFIVAWVIVWAMHGVNR